MTSSEQAYSTSSFYFDQKKLAQIQEERQPIYVLQWLQQFHKTLKTCGPEGIKTFGGIIEKELLRQLSLGQPRPKLAHRQELERCFISLIQKKPDALTDTVRLLQSLIAASSSSTGEEETKLAAIRVLGGLFREFGEKLTFQVFEVIQLILKAYKQGEEVTKNEVCLALIGIMKGGSAKQIPEALIKTLAKQFKAEMTSSSNVTSSKNSRVRVYACELVELIITRTSYYTPLTLPDLEQHLYFGFRAMDSRFLPTRKAAAQYISGILVKALTQPPLPQTSSEIAVGMTLEQVLQHLSGHFHQAKTGKYAMAGVAQAYAAFLHKLGPEWVELNYARIIRHLFLHLCNTGESEKERFAAGYVEYLVLKVIFKLMNETSRVQLLNELCRSWLKMWPAVLKGEQPPSPHNLAVALDLAASLMQQLRGACRMMQSQAIEPVLVLLTHPVVEVRLKAARCAGVYALRVAGPAQLAELVPKVFHNLQQSLNDPIKSHGYANALAELVKVVPQRPLSVSHEYNAWTFSLAVQLLSKPDENSVKSQQIAWVLISALMNGGPDFTNLHLAQLMLLWKAALPKLNRNSVGGRRVVEPDWPVVMETRQLACKAMWTFLHHQKGALGVEVVKRLAALLSNVWMTAKECPTTTAAAASTTVGSNTSTVGATVIVAASNGNSGGANSTAIEISMKEAKQQLEGLVFQCYESLRQNKIFESAWIQLVKSCVDGFTMVEEEVSNEGVTSVLSLNDVTSFGLTNLLPLQKEGFPPVDPLLLTNNDASRSLADNSISLLSALYQDLSEQLQDHVMDLLFTNLHNVQLERLPERQLAIHVNVVVALGEICRKLRKAKAVLSVKAASVAQEMVKELVGHVDWRIRDLATDTLGLLVTLTTTNNAPFVQNQLQMLVDQVVQNPAPELRAGASLALARICEQVGHLAAMNHLKAVVSVLHSLALDPHVLVHEWALRSLLVVAESVGLGFGPFVHSTAGILARVFSSEYQEVRSLVGNIIATLVGTLGPDFQASGRLKDIFLTMAEDLRSSSDELDQIAAIRCYRQLVMLTPELVDQRALVGFLQSRLSEGPEVLRRYALLGLEQLIKRDIMVTKLAPRKGLELDLFRLLDRLAASMTKDISTIVEVEKVLLNLLSSTDDPSIWVMQCAAILSTTSTFLASSSASIADTMNDNNDEFVVTRSAQVSTQTFGWRTKFFALQGLRHLISLPSLKDNTMLVGDLIRMAFTATTSPIEDMRMEGLRLLFDVLKNFGNIEDPEFEGSSLLEQYQAQITSALMPAFSLDSSPELVGLGFVVAGYYVGSGIVKDLTTLNRVVKVLLDSLEFCKEGTISFVENPSPHAAMVIKLAILHSWADLFHAASLHSYLLSLVEPHLPLLQELWLGSLKEYALLRENVEGGNGKKLTAKLQLVILAPFYQEAWVSLIYAVSFKELSSSSEFLLGLCIDGLLGEVTAPTGKKSLVLALQKFIPPCFSSQTAMVELLLLLDRLAQLENDEIRTVLVQICTDLTQKHSFFSDQLEEELVLLLRIITHILAIFAPGLVIVDKSFLSGITFRDLTEKSGELFQQCLDLLLFLYSKADNKADSFLSLLTDLLIVLFRESKAPELTGPILLLFVRNLLKLPLPLEVDQVKVQQNWSYFLYSLNSACFSETLREESIPAILSVNAVVLSLLLPSNPSCFVLYRRLLAAQLSSSQDFKILCCALHCCRTLLSMTSSSDLVKNATRLLLTDLLEFTPTLRSRKLLDADAIRLQMEVLKLLELYATSFKTVNIYSKILTIWVDLLDGGGEGGQHLALAEVLLANPEVFKPALVECSETVRQKIEQTLRQLFT